MKRIILLIAIEALLQFTVYIVLFLLLFFIYRLTPGANMTGFGILMTIWPFSYTIALIVIFIKSFKSNRNMINFDLKTRLTLSALPIIFIIGLFVLGGILTLLTSALESAL